MVVSLRFALSLVLFGSAAAADCPTASDLAGGIRVRWSGGLVTTIRATDDPVMMSVRSDWGDDGHMVERVAWGLYTVEDIEIEGSDRDFLTHTEYGIEPTHLPRPTAGTEVRFAEVYHGYHWPMWTRETFAMGQPASVTLAGCVYRSFEVSLVRADILSDTVPADDPRRMGRISRGWTYLTDLGFALEAWRGPPENRYPASDIIAIEAVR